jgi:formamidopyrimidine-DNA glycosylase
VFNKNKQNKERITMPELPEVETIVRQLHESLIGKKISQVEIRRPRQWKGFPTETAVRMIANQQIQDIKRRAKFIVFDLTNNLNLIIHLRMTGKLLLAHDEFTTNKFTRTIFHFDDGSRLCYNDVRALGSLELIDANQCPKCLLKLGIEPLSSDFTLEALQELLSKSKLTIKEFLLNQNRIVGIGNIYASEILFLSRINPTRRANELIANEQKQLFHFIPEVLSQAISRMGTTFGHRIADYRNIYNIEGDFQNFLKVYDREGKPCLDCSNTIIRIVQKGRSSFLCEQCQK